MTQSGERKCGLVSNFLSPRQQGVGIDILYVTIPIKYAMMTNLFVIKKSGSNISLKKNCWNCNFSNSVFEEVKMLVHTNSLISNGRKLNFMARNMGSFILTKCVLHLKYL